VAEAHRAEPSRCRAARAAGVADVALGKYHIDGVGRTGPRPLTVARDHVSPVGPIPPCPPPVPELLGPVGHNSDVDVLVTGGAGFIGSHLVDGLVERGHSVRVLDDLFSGSADDVNGAAELVIGSTADEALVRGAVEGAEVVFHLAAHRAVLRSVEEPLATDTANVHGTLTVLKAATDSGVRRVVYASSSSVYGGADQLPTPESAPTIPRSPYAVTKLVGEHYCRVFAELYGLETVSLRYFNVFGPRQRPDSAYAAVIPLFIQALLARQPPTVHGGGHQTRDFTYVSDVVAANFAAVASPVEACNGRAYNVAAGESHSLLDLLSILEQILGRDVDPVHTGPRAGDIPHSRADPTAAHRDLGFRCDVDFKDGLRRTVAWFAGE
jgi:nucleoside-diphosphate-sugar epimerase